MYIYPTLSGAGASWWSVRTAGGSVVFLVYMGSNTELFLINGDLSTITGPFAPWTANRWQRLSFAYVITSTTNYTIKVWIDGVLITTATQADATLTRTGTSLLHLQANGSSLPGPSYVSDVYIDDSTALSDPGDIRVTPKLPVTLHTNNFDTLGGSGANRYDRVSERALSETNYIAHLAATDVQENFGIHTAAAGDIDISNRVIVGYSGWVWAKRGVTAGGSPKLMVNGIESSLTLTNTAALYTSSVLSSVYPTNVAGIGMRSSGTTAETYFYEGGLLIAYTLDTPLGNYVLVAN